jgi:hypothetical protein
MAEERGKMGSAVGDYERQEGTKKASDRAEALTSEEHKRKERAHCNASRCVCEREGLKHDKHTPSRS